MDMPCGLCIHSVGMYSAHRGWLELPLDPARATYIYENADRAETEDLVCQTWDREGEHWCNVCNLKGHQCRDCYQLECEGQERSYRTGILNRRMEHDC